MSEDEKRNDGSNSVLESSARLARSSKCEVVLASKATAPKNRFTVLASSSKMTRRKMLNTISEQIMADSVFWALIPNSVRATYGENYVDKAIFKAS